MQSKYPDWERVASARGPSLKLFQVRYDEMRNPRNGKTERMVVLESADAANVVAQRSQDGALLFVHQYRFGIGRYTLELPGGMVDPGEAHEQAARRELREEAGAEAPHWQYLGCIPSNPVFQDSYIYHWFAKDVVLRPPQLDEGEDVYLEWLPLEEVHRRLYSGQLEHPHTVNALLCFFHHQQNATNVPLL